MRANSKPLVGILDYGIGNLTSVARALEVCNARPVIVYQPSELGKLDALVLPGVGAFGAACESMRSSGMDLTVPDFADSGKPLLGICLGMQLMLDISEESRGQMGLSLFRGANRRLETVMNKPEAGKASKGQGSGYGFGESCFKVPHTGWNDVFSIKDVLGPLMEKEREKFYFTHSFAAYPDDEAIIAAKTPLVGDSPGDGPTIAAAIRKGNVIGVQFHPEKSGEAGLRLLSGFVSLGRGAYA